MKKPYPPPDSLVHQLAQLMGGFSVLGREFGLSAWAVQKWWRKESIPPERVIQLTRLAMGHGMDVRPHDFRPDVYLPNMKIPKKLINSLHRETV